MLEKIRQYADGITHREYKTQINIKRSQRGELPLDEKILVRGLPIWIELANAASSASENWRPSTSVETGAVVLIATLGYALSAKLENDRLNDTAREKARGTSQSNPR